LPEDASEPRIYKRDDDADPVLRLAITSDRMSAPEITDFAERYIVDRLATIDGVDISAGMLAQARAGGHYRRLWLAEPGAPLPCGEAAYTLAAAAGAISPGAAPPEAFDLVWSALRPGGIFALSLNDMALQARDYEARVAEHADCGAAEVLEREHGAHVPAEGVGAVVYVLRKR